MLKSCAYLFCKTLETELCLRTALNVRAAPVTSSSLSCKTPHEHKFYSSPAVAELSGPQLGSMTSQHFEARAFYMGSDVDIQAIAEKLSGRCLSLRKDFVVVTLGPPTSITVDPARLQFLQSQLDASQRLLSTSSPRSHLESSSNGRSSSSSGLSLCEEDGRSTSGAWQQQHQHINYMTSRLRQLFFARLSSNPYQSYSDPPRRFPYPSDLWRADLVSEEHVMKHAMMHGIMITFKFGCTVFFKPRIAELSSEATESQTSNALHQGRTQASDNRVSLNEPGGPLSASSAANTTSRYSSSSSSLASEKRAAAARRDEQRAAEDNLEQELSRMVRTAVTDPVQARPKMEEAHIVLRPGLKKLFAKEPDRVAVTELDLGNLEVICRVLGQSAALDFYTSQVDDSLRDFDKILLELAEHAGKPFYQRPFMMMKLRGGDLLALIASSLLMYNKVVSKLGLLDTSRTAWESDDHDAVWRGLKREYELEQRFENLLKKLDIYKEESRYILEVRNVKFSATAEVVIIALIAVEILANTAFHFLL
ncbi:hypothetical protein CEUSTIGMA_g4312.t1 [Chlamydomonas eustigma]|uniref:DUF155 domain-containing protein n=1 Tax=Chlamydomonas eustigma TaxID=1157962 RepID=A0A250X1D4_9CHLO|nr:hypothetical protein CEUSTIGMA_g4312.t1 [Chlamydomonas eustigma]|eukprot:GAX76866.1 hypothetical protein CEUSTIGMA_g4312.t1 [Chlamydomonas eustigma]